MWLLYATVRRLWGPTRYPRIARKPSCLGPRITTGIALSGATYHVELAGYNQKRVVDPSSPVADPNAVFPLDRCFGHPYLAQYHYHGPSWACFDMLPSLSKTLDDPHAQSPLLGYASGASGEPRSSWRGSSAERPVAVLLKWSPPSLPTRVGASEQPFRTKAPKLAGEKERNARPSAHYVPHRPPAESKWNEMVGNARRADHQPPSQEHHCPARRRAGV